MGTYKAPIFNSMNDVNCAIKDMNQRKLSIIDLFTFIHHSLKYK